MQQYNSSIKDLSKLVQRKLRNVKGKYKASYEMPNEEILDELFETLFYTSLKTEEAQFIKVTITFIDSKNPDPSPPEYIDANRWKFVRFPDEIEFSVKNLVKLSKAADVWSSSLAVHYDESNNLVIWGMIDQAIHYHSFLNFETEAEPEQPGLFQATIIGIGNINVLIDYELIANLKQNNLIRNYLNVFNFGEIKHLLDDKNETLRNSIVKYATKELSDEVEYWSNHCDEVFKQVLRRILLRIQNYQHGGTILFIRNLRGGDIDIKYKIEYNRLIESIENLLLLSIQIDKFDYQVDKYVEKGIEQVSTLDYLNDSIAKIQERETREELKGAIRFVASLSCVDGLIAIGNNFKILGFGAIIKIKEIPEFVYISKTAAINNSKLVKVSSDSFGTRHRSMFAYCLAHEGAIGFVISQDGDIRAITNVEGKVILWENIRVLQFIQSKRLSRLLQLRK